MFNLLEYFDLNGVGERDRQSKYKILQVFSNTKC
jgi:hypothetical protein